MFRGNGERRWAEGRIVELALGSKVEARLAYFDCYVSWFRVRCSALHDADDATNREVLTGDLKTPAIARRFVHALNPELDTRSE